MANRYWVGGTGTWDTTTTNWSDTSGGAGGATAPTSADNVFFDSASSAGAYTVTISGSKTIGNLSINGPASGAVTFGTGTVTCTGTSLFIAATGVNAMPTNLGVFSSSATVKTNNVPIGGLTLSASGGTISLTSALTVTGFTGISFAQGTYNFDGYPVTATELNASSTFARVINFGASAITLTASNSNVLRVSTTTTLNGTSSTISVTGTSASLTNYSTNAAFGDITITGAQSSTTTLIGSFTFNNVTWAATTVENVARCGLVINGNLTVNGTFAVNGASNSRKTLLSGIGALASTGVVTCAAITGLTNVDIGGITAAGASAPWVGTDLGNAGGNSNITGYATAKNVYYNSTVASWNSSSSWGLSEGGATSFSYIPHPQDTAYFRNGYPSGSLIYNSQSEHLLCNINATARTTSLVINNTYGISAGTSYVMGSTASFNGVVFGGAGVISYSGPAIAGTLTVGAYTQSTIFRLSGDFTHATTVTHNTGTVDLNGYTLYTGAYSIPATAYASNIKSGATGKIHVTSTSSSSPWSLNSSTATVEDTLDVYVTGDTASTRAITNIQPTTTPVEKLAKITVTAGSGTVNAFANAANVYQNVTFASGFTGTVGRPSANVTIRGSLILNSSVAVGTSGASTITWDVPAGNTGTFNTYGKTFDNSLTVAGAGTHSLASAWTSPTGSSGLRFTGSSTFNSNGNSITVFTVTVSGTGDRTFNLDGSTITTSSQIVYTETTSGTSTYTGDFTVVGTNSSAKSFYLNGRSFNRIQSLSSVMAFYGGGGIGELVGTSVTFSFQPSQVYTVGALSVDGVSGANTTLTSTSASQYTLSKESGNVNLSYVSLGYCNAVGGAVWDAYTSNGCVNLGNNSGINFEPAAPAQNLAASVTITAVSTASLNTPKSMVVSAGVVCSATSALITSKDLASVATSVTSGTVALTTPKELAATVVAEVSADVALTIIVLPRELAAEVVVVSTGSAELSVVKDLSAAASAAVVAVAPLLVGKNLNLLVGTGAITNVLSASVQLQKPIAATAVAVNTASVVLAKQAALASSVVMSTSMAAAPLSKGANLVAAVSAVSSSTATVSSPKVLSAIASCTAVGTATCAVENSLAASTTVQSAADANVDVLRLLAASAFCQGYVVGSFDRFSEVEGVATASVSVTSSALSVTKTVAGAMSTVATASGAGTQIVRLSCGAYADIGYVDPDYYEEPGAAATATATLYTALYTQPLVCAVSATATLSKVSVHQAAVQVVSTGAADIDLDKPIASAAVATVTAIPNLLVGVNLNIVQGQGAITNVLAADLAVEKIFLGSVSCLVSVSSGLIVSKDMASTVEASTSVTAEIDITKTMGVLASVEATSSAQADVTKPFAAAALCLATLDGVLVYSHLNDLEDIGVATATVTYQQYFATVEVITATAVATQSLVYADVTGGQIYASVNDGQIYATAELVEDYDLTVSTVSENIYLYRQAA